MCGRITTVQFDEMLEVFQAIESELAYNKSPDWPAVRPVLESRHEAFPNSIVAPIYTDADAPKTLFASPMTWGFVSDGKKDVIFNTRIETADNRPMWKDSFENRRCIVPVLAFYEPDRSEKAVNPKTGREIKQTYRFTDPEDGIILLAGIWKDDRFSILTMKPNSIVGTVHDRMPVMFNLEDACSWLSGTSLEPNDIVANLLVKEPLYKSGASEQLNLF